MKNTQAIQKIIGELSYRDYLSSWEEYKKQNHSIVKQPFSVDTGADTLDAIQVRNDYLQDKISEEEYKTYCLRYNLLIGGKRE